jgi:hypothetical protein
MCALLHNSLAAVLWHVPGGVLALQRPALVRRPVPLQVPQGENKCLQIQQVFCQRLCSLCLVMKATTYMVDTACSTSADSTFAGSHLQHASLTLVSAADAWRQLESAKNGGEGGSNVHAA